MKPSLAIIGTGIAGLACAHHLQHRYDLTLYERNPYIGGHSNTVFVEENGRKIPIDTGFMVFNHVTYPNLIQLFSELGVDETATDMSFSLQHANDKMEWSGASMDRLFCRRSNLTNLRYWKMLLQLKRFNEEASAAIQSGLYKETTLAEYIEKRGYGSDLLRWYLVPISAAIWSTPSDEMLQFPIETLLRFFTNHGFLGQTTQHQWYTLSQGSQAYVHKLTQPFRDKILLSTGVAQVNRKENGAEVLDAHGQRKQYDAVIFASHADEALAMLDTPTMDEAYLLSSFTYQANIARLHTDSNVMPSCKRCWSSWNYCVDDESRASTHYWMNALQPLNAKKNYFVSINGEQAIDPAKIIRQFNYHHPVFTNKAISAQASLKKLNEHGPIYFCGSYFKYGFHEDAYTSGLELSQHLLKLA